MISLLSELDRRLEQTMAQPVGSLDSLRHLIDQLGTRQYIVPLLQEILLEPASLSEIAKRSYVHPNGYDKILLVSKESTEVPYELRMHVWWADHGRLPTDIHNHDWDFSSRILCGRLECQEYEIGEDGVPMLRYSYVRSAKGLFLLQPQGIYKIRPSRRYSLRPGQSYSMQRSTLHRAAGAEGCTTATLLLQGPTHHLSSTIYRDPGFTGEHISSPIEPMRPEALAIKLLELVRLLETLPV